MKHRFTLIELLVVVAIIAILASLLLPALASARGKARITDCMGNFKQMGIGFQMYADEWDDWMPQTARHSSGWMRGLAPYCGYDGDLSVLSVSSTSATAVDRKVPIFLCPETKSWYFRWYTGRTYGINMQISNGRSDIGSYSARRKMNQLTFPDRTYLASDSNHYTPIEWASLSSSIKTPAELGQPDTRSSKYHMQRTLNFLFPDGHVINLTRGIRFDLLMTDTGAPGWY